MFWHINLTKYHITIRNDDIGGHFMTLENVYKIILIGKAFLQCTCSL